jgi:predicted alpha/beta superfamily hydrolase
LSIYCTAQSKGSPIVIGQSQTIYSQILKEKREILISVPDRPWDSLFSPSQYPVIYLLDGEAHFNTVTAMVRQLNSFGVMPPAIVVGIVNTDRTRDLTPTHMAVGFPFMDSNFVRNSGGGERFTAFLEQELIPHIDTTYATAPYRIFIGHSFGGLLVMNSFLHHNSLFNAYVSIDPSLWWDNEKMVKDGQAVFAGKTFSGKTLFMPIANTLNDGLDTILVRKDTAATMVHMRSLLRFTDYLKQYNGRGLRWGYKFYKEESHNSIPIISEYDALRFIYQSYAFPSPERLYDTSLSLQAAKNSIAAHYKQLSKELGYNVPPSEQLVNSLGYHFLRTKNYMRAYAYFVMNVENYPLSFNVYDSLGDYYRETGENQKAVENFKKALAIRKLPDTQEKLEKLRKL